MANAGKVLALIGAIFTILGTFFFTLVESFPGLYVYGAGGMLNIDDIFITAASGTWQYWIVGIVTILYLISGFIQLLGIKSRIASFLGSLLPITVAIFIILALAGVGATIVLYVLVLSAAPLVPNFIPVVFEYGFMDLGFGTIFIALGGLLSLVSVFMSRED